MILAILITIFAIPAGSTLTFTWTPPTTNTNGSPLTDLRGYKLYEKVGAAPYAPRMGISPKISKISYKAPYTTGIHKYKLTAINMARKESAPSNEVEVNLEVLPPPPSMSPSPTPVR